MYNRADKVSLHRRFSSSFFTTTSCRLQSQNHRTDERNKYGQNFGCDCRNFPCTPAKQSRKHAALDYTAGFQSHLGMFYSESLVNSFYLKHQGYANLHSLSGPTVSHQAREGQYMLMRGRKATATAALCKCQPGARGLRAGTTNLRQICPQLNKLSRAGTAAFRFNVGMRIDLPAGFQSRLAERNIQLNDVSSSVSVENVGLS
ncbi:hypothetical protein MHYP_G00313050 [Metynnis hypsauchen]